MRLVPLSEGGGVDLHHGGSGEGVGADELIVGRVEGHDDHSHFAGHSLGAPAEVAGVDAEGAVFGVAAAGAHEMDAFVADSRVGWLATFLESSVIDLLVFWWEW